MKSYTSIEELIELFEADIAELNSKIKTLKTKPKSLNEEILLKYIETASTGKTKEFVRAKGVQSGSGSMFSSADVSKLVKDGAGDVSEGLLTIARQVGVLTKRKNKSKK
ncbi:hypothetical protein N9L48_04730 [Psychrosphaera sp.]|nr:hypothetical protein [Psychrosphaera sp.]